MKKQYIKPIIAEKVIIMYDVLTASSDNDGDYVGNDIFNDGGKI